MPSGAARRTTGTSCAPRRPGDPVPVVVCPKCQAVMLEWRRGETTVDVCPKCGGAWLDKGELERLRPAHREPDTDADPPVPSDPFPAG